MSSKTETKSALHWDLAAAAVVLAAAMVFLPFLRKILLWPTLALFAVLAVWAAVVMWRKKPPAVSYNFTPAPGVPTTLGTTDFVRKSLADKINGLDWLPFEQLVTGLYATLGYTSKRLAGPHADGGVDLILQKNKDKTFVQCKHWKVAEVDEKELKEFLGVLTREKIENGIFVTAREFSLGARRFAAMNNLLVVGMKDLVRMLEGAGWEKNSGLKAALEQSRKFCPRCQKDMILKNAEAGPNPGSRVWVCTGLPLCNYTVNV